MSPAIQNNRLTSLWQRLSLQVKLSICFVGMTVIPLVVTTAILGYNGDKALNRLVKEHNWNTALHTAEDIDQAFGDKIRALQVAAATADIKSMRPARQLPVLRAIAEQDAEVLSVGVADADGRLLIRSDDWQDEAALATYSDQSYFQTAKQTGKTTLSDSTVVSPSTGYPKVIIAQPVKGEQQEVLGVLLLTVKLGTVIEHIGQTKFGENGYIYLVNQEGRILLHPDRERLASGTDVSHLAPVQAVMNRQDGWLEYEVNRQRKLAAYSYIRQTGWGLVAEQPLAEALEYVVQVKQTGFLMSMVAALIAGLLSLVVAGKMSRRITSITAVTERLAAGDLDVLVEATSQDEIGQLAITFNAMVAKLKASGAKLRDSEEKYRSLVENINIGVYRKTCQDDSYIEYANPALARMLGFATVEELLQTSAAIHFSDRGDFVRLLGEIDQQGAVKNKEIQLTKLDGTAIWCSVTAVKHYDANRQLYWIDSVVKDISERKAAEEALRQAHAELERKVEERTQELRVLNEKLYQLSLYDSMTDIANRRYFDEFLEREWRRAKREQLPLAIILLDVDWFKQYNDTYGHVAGDQCLRQVAAVLQTVAKRATDLAARYGGEEFALVLPNTDQQGAVELGQQILAAVRALKISSAVASSYQIVTVSLGIAACIPRDSTAASDLIVAADQALYQAKHAGRNQLQTAQLLKISGIKC